MEEKMTEEKFIRFERRWTTIFRCFALILVASIVVFIFGLVQGSGILWGVASGVASFAGALFSANQLRDPALRKGVWSTLETLDEM